MFATVLLCSTFAAGWDRLPPAHPLRVLALVDVPRDGKWTVGVILRYNRVRVMGPLPATRAAAARLDDRTRTHPNDADAWDELAEHYVALGQLGAAAQARERGLALRRMAVTAAPADPKPRGELAVALVRAGHRTEAAAEAKALAALPADDYDTWAARAWVLQELDDPAAANALAQAKTRLPADDPDRRIGFAFMALHQTRTAGGSAAEAVADAEAAIRALLANPGPAPDRPTAERRLALLVVRDLMRTAARDPDAPARPVVASDTLDLVRELVPADAADPVIPFAAIWAERLAAAADPFRDDPKLQAKLAAATAPYLDALARLGKSADPATAATARCLRGIAVMLSLSDPSAATDETRADFRAAAERVPGFDLAWSCLALTSPKDRQAAVLDEWVRATDSPLARYVRAKHYVDDNDWTAAEVVIYGGRPRPAVLPAGGAGQPNTPLGDPRLALGKAACLLRKGPAGVAAAGDLLREVSQTPACGTGGEWDVTAHHLRLSALACALTGHLDHGRLYANGYVRWAAHDKEAAADAARVRAVFGP